MTTGVYDVILQGYDLQVEVIDYSPEVVSSFDYEGEGESIEWNPVGLSELTADLITGCEAYSDDITCQLSEAIRDSQEL